MDSFDSIDQLEKHRKNISYNMSNEDKHKYDNFKKIIEHIINYVNYFHNIIKYF